MKEKMISKEMTADEVLILEEEFELENADIAKEKPYLSPFSQWCALHELDECKRLFESGDEFLLMTAIRICANHDLPMPNWVATNYIKAYQTVVGARSKSWDQVFGLPYPKGTHLNAVRKKRLLKFRVWSDVKKILNMNPKTPIDEAIFELVGKRVGIGKTLASEYYYAVVKITGY